MYSLTKKDDVGFKYGDCEDPHFESVTCDFEEEHICGYTSDSVEDFNWIRRSGRGQSNLTGPSFDVNNNKVFILIILK